MIIYISQFIIIFLLSALVLSFGVVIYLAISVQGRFFVREADLALTGSKKED
jgi:hypothetical protein